MKPVIKSTKHYNQFSPTTIAAGVLATFDISIAVAVPDISTAIEVEEGALVKAIFIEVWLASDDTAQTSFQLMIEKIPTWKDTGDYVTFTIANSLGAYSNKKNVLYVTRGLAPASSFGNPVPVVRGWFKIPKGKQRMGLGDKLVMSISAIANGITWCGFMTYKEYK